MEALHDRSSTTGSCTYFNVFVMIRVLFDSVRPKPDTKLETNDTELCWICFRILDDICLLKTESVSLPHQTSDIWSARFWQAYRHDRRAEWDCVLQPDQGNVIVVVQIVWVVVTRVNMYGCDGPGGRHQGVHISQSHVNLHSQPHRNTSNIEATKTESSALQLFCRLTRTFCSVVLTPRCSRTWAAVKIQRSETTIPPALLPPTLSITCQGMVFCGASLPPTILW